MSQRAVEQAIGRVAGESSRAAVVPPAHEAVATNVDRDAELVEALRLGEAAAAERLVATYGDRAYRLAVRITGNAQDAEEAVQDACWSVVRKIGAFRGDAAFRSWLYRIVANAARQRLRARRGEQADRSLVDVLAFVDAESRHDASIADWSARLDDPAVKAELRMVLTAAIGDLPGAYRTVVLLHDVEGSSNREVGAALGISIANVKSRVHRARLFLRKRLGDYMTTTGGHDRESQGGRSESLRPPRRVGTHPRGA